MRLRIAVLAMTPFAPGPLLAQAPVAPAAPLSVAAAPSLEDQFRDPPLSARPRVWWHWMNGNITRDGIAKDMAWMKRAGIGGLQNFDANLATPQIVDHRLVYMTPEWRDAFRFAASEAQRQGLELGIASSPGWSESGGPWVSPADGMKKLAWSEASAVGGKRFIGKLPMPPAVTGLYQDLPMATGNQDGLGIKQPQPEFYRDVAVLAYPVAKVAPLPVPVITTGDGKSVDPAPLLDDSLTTGIPLPAGAGGQPPALVLDFRTSQTVRSLTLFAPGTEPGPINPGLMPRLEASDDGKKWCPVIAISPSPVPSTVSFAPVTARLFRVVFERARASAMGGGFMPPAGVDLAGMAGSMMAGMASQGPSIAMLRLSGEAKINQFESKAGFAVANDYYGLDAGVGEDSHGPAPEAVIDLTARLRPDGTLDWSPPRLPRGSEWRIVRLGSSLLGTTNHPATPEATGLEVDKLDADAVRRYLEHYIAMYRDATGADLLGDRGVRALVTDSTEVGTFNWTPRMVEQFRRLRGYDPIPWLPTLTGMVIGSRARSDAFLYDFRRTIADLHASAHYGTVAEVARANGLTVYGEALESSRPSLGDDMAMRSYTDIPMSAMWYIPRANPPMAVFLADMKGASSVAHLYGQNLAAAESMTSVLMPWGTAPDDLRHTIDLEFASGINRPVIHTSVHQPSDDKLPGLSLGIFGQYFNRHETWAEMARPWVDYISRNALMLQQGRNVADVAYFYGEEAPLVALYHDHPVADAPRTSGYDFVNVAALISLLHNDGGDLVAPSGARYRVLYLGGSSSHMTLATLQRIDALVAGGATVVGLAPTVDPGLGDDPAAYAALVARLWPTARRQPTEGPRNAETTAGRGRVIASSDIEAALRQIGVAPDFAISGGQADTDIPFVHRKLADGDSYFLVNRKYRAETITAHFRVTGKAPELWHADTGEIEPASYRITNGETLVPMTLGPEESVHVVFRRPATRDELTLFQPPLAVLGEIGGAWNVSFQTARGAPASTVLQSLTPLSINPDPGIKYFSGIATYAKDFAAPKGWKPGQKLWLDLGAVGDLADATVNAMPVGAAWHTPFRLDITAAVHTGRNHLEVRVADLWVNRLIGDAQPGAKKIAWTATPTYLASAQPRPSGLIGPVRIEGVSTSQPSRLPFPLR